MMDIALIRDFLLWCAAINIGLLLWWVLTFVFAHDWILSVHRRWFKVSEEQFDAIHYAGMALFKLAIFVFNLVPFFALLIVG